MSPTILLTGKNGQIGSDLLKCLPSLGKVVAPDRTELDLRNAGGLRRAVREIQPQLIINTAAYTDVDRAETDRETAFAVNGEAPGILAREGKKFGAAIVHFSTDYVFDGSKKSPYLETDLPNPVNVYGQSKLAGELTVQGSGAPYLILRTAWVYSRRGRNFALTILRLSTEKEELRVVCDQIGAPTLSREVAAGTVRILQQIGNHGLAADSFSRFSGIYHITAGGETSWFEFAKAILHESSEIPQEAPWITAATGGRPRLARRVTPISTGQYPTPARRPAYSVLSNVRLREAFGFQLPAWRTQLKELFLCTPNDDLANP
jgi:dTDP-4-dehydrorhamnose reductase